MPTLSNVQFLLDPKTASMAATASKNTRKAGKNRMMSPTAKRTMKNALKAKAQSKNFNNIYKSLWALGEYGILNRSVNNIIGVYPFLNNHVFTQKQRDRLLRIMKRHKDILRSELNKRNNDRMRLERPNLNSNSNSESRKNYNNNSYWGRRY